MTRSTNRTSPTEYRLKLLYCAPRAILLVGENSISVEQWQCFFFSFLRIDVRCQSLLEEINNIVLFFLSILIHSTILCVLLLSLTNECSWIDDHFADTCSADRNNIEGTNGENSNSMKGICIRRRWKDKARYIWKERISSPHGRHFLIES